MKLEIFKEGDLYRAEYTHEYSSDEDSWVLNEPMKLDELIEYLIEKKKIHAVDVADALIDLDPALGKKYFGVP